jgi:hypothetical protein
MLYSCTGDFDSELDFQYNESETMLQYLKWEVVSTLMFYMYHTQHQKDKTVHGHRGQQIIALVLHGPLFIFFGIEKTRIHCLKHEQLNTVYICCKMGVQF